MVYKVNLIVLERFCLDAKLIGAENHLICDKSGYEWRKQKPQDVIVLSRDDKDLNSLQALIRLGLKSIDLNVPENLYRSFVELSPLLMQDDVLWSRVMTRKQYSKFIEGLIERVWSIMPSLPTGYFEGTWKVGNEVLRSLRRAQVDTNKWQAYVQSKSGAVVESFKPGRGGYLPIVEYDRFGAVTGRLTVTDGPKIHSLNSEMRDMIVSVYPGGRIYSVDFSAFETRIVMYEANLKADHADVYQTLSRQLGGFDRDTTKSLVISRMYGAGKASLEDRLQLPNKLLDQLLDKLESMLNINGLLNRIKHINTPGMIVNRYGRPIRTNSTSPLLNYYVQSTGADVALLAFAKLQQSWAESAKDDSKVRSLFLVHDELMIDVPPNMFDVVESTRSVTVSGYVQPFIVEVEQVC